MVLFFFLPVIRNAVLVSFFTIGGFDGVSSTKELSLSWNGAF